MENERLKMISGKPFNTRDFMLMQDKENARKLCKKFNDSEEDSAFRKKLLTELFGNCGTDILIKPPFYCDYGYSINVGDNFFANFDCVFLDSALITIGDNCMIGPKTCIYTIQHPLDYKQRKKSIGQGLPVQIGNDVWIGGSVTILPGVNIGDRTVVGAGSVVTKSLPNDVVIAGNPARIIRDMR